MPERIYLDHSATTPVDPRVLEAMLPYFSERFGNPSSPHHEGQTARRALEQARATIAAVLNAAPDEIVFTSGGSESDNLALRGVALAQAERGKGRHIVTTAIEHHAVLHTVEDLAQRHGFEVTLVQPDATGRITPEAVAAALRPDTVLVSVMYANNEVGTVNPIAEIARVVRERGIPFHTDAVQAPGYLPLDVQALGVDLLTLSGHKVYGPKGVGLLYIRRGVPLHPLITGGPHEGHRRAGTEAVPLIVGLAEALRLAEELRPTESARLARLRDRLLHEIPACIPEAQVSGHPTERLPFHASFTFAGLSGDALIRDLDELGFAVSGGSACSSGDQTPSHVLSAMGVPPERLMGPLRITLGRGTTEAHIERLLEVLPQLVARQRALLV